MVLKLLQHGCLYDGSAYSAGPFVNFAHFRNSDFRPTSIPSWGYIKIWELPNNRSLNMDHKYQGPCYEDTQKRTAQLTETAILKPYVEILNIPYEGTLDPQGFATWDHNIGPY